MTNFHFFNNFLLIPLLCKFVVCHNNPQLYSSIVKNPIKHTHIFFYLTNEDLHTMSSDLMSKIDRLLLHYQTFFLLQNEYRFYKFLRQYYYSLYLQCYCLYKKRQQLLHNIFYYHFFYYKTQR